MKAGNRAQIEARRDSVLELLLEGASVREVARRIGISHTQIRRDRDARLTAIAKTNPAPERYRQLQVLRAERLLRTCMPLALGREEVTNADGAVVAAAVPPDWQAFDRVLRCIEVLSRLYGIDAQDTVSVNVQQYPSVITVEHTPGPVDPEIIDGGNPAKATHTHTRRRD